MREILAVEGRAFGMDADGVSFGSLDELWQGLMLHAGVRACEKFEQGMTIVEGAMAGPFYAPPPCVPTRTQ